MLRKKDRNRKKDFLNTFFGQIGSVNPIPQLKSMLGLVDKLHCIKALLNTESNCEFTATKPVLTWADPRL